MTRTFTAVFQAGGLAGGTTHQNTSLVIHNLSSQKLGSANITAAALGTNSFQIIGATTSQGTVDLTGAPGLLKLRDLSLASDASLTVQMTVKPTCATGSYTWTIAARQQGDFSGSDFTLQTTDSHMTTTVSVGCRLVWGTQPRSAVLNTQITGSDYDSTGGAVTVNALDGDNQAVTSWTATVSLAKTAGVFTSAGDLIGKQASLSAGGTATFSSFKSTASASDLRVTASADDFLSTPASDPPFDISLVASRGCGNNCSLPATALDKNPTSKASATLSGASATFLALNTATSIPSTVTDPGGGGGCAGFVSVGASGFEASDSRGSAGGQLQFAYYIDKNLLQKRYGSNQGSQFVPICAGAAQVDSQGNIVNCIGQGFPYGPWKGKALDTLGRFNGLTRDAVCDPVTGLYWGILGSFQDYTNSDPSLRIDPLVHPTITAWSSDGTYRIFFGTVPAPWDWRATG